MTDLEFTPSERDYNAFVRAVDDACRVLTLPIAAGAVGMREGDLRAALDGRNGRRLDAKVGAVIAKRVGPGIYRDAIAAAIKELFGLYEREADGPYAHRLEGALLSFGAPGAEVLAKCRREARRG